MVRICSSMRDIRSPAVSGAMTWPVSSEGGAIGAGCWSCWTGCSFFFCHGQKAASPGVGAAAKATAMMAAPSTALFTIVITRPSSLRPPARPSVSLA